MTSTTLCIGDIGVSLKNVPLEQIPPELLPWIARDNEIQTVSCTSLIAPLPPLDIGDIVFDSNKTWQVHKTDAGIRILVLFGEQTRMPCQVLELNDSLTEGHATLDSRVAFDTPPPFALHTPLLELWTSFLLMRGRGLLVHGAGVLINGRVHVFVGKSGAGKSTLSNVFVDNHMGEILSDDRLIIRPSASGYRVFGTPWHGEAHLSSAASGPLAGVYFLKQAPHNQLIRADAAFSTAAMMATCFIAGWPRDKGLQFCLDMCAQIAASVPCNTFEFTPTVDAVHSLSL